MVLASKSSGAISIFISYAQSDELLWEKLEKHLSPLRRLNLITGWHSSKVMPGVERAKDISKHLNSAQVVLLLVSPDFTASELCYDIEMKLAMERHSKGDIRIIPVILRPIDWKITPLGKLQPLPANGKPVTSWIDDDEAFYNIALGIKNVIEEITSSPIPVFFTEKNLESSDANAKTVEELKKVQVIKADLMELQNELSEENVYHIHNDKYEDIKQNFRGIRENVSTLTSRYVMRQCFKSVDRAYTNMDKAIEELELALYLLEQLMKEKKDITQLARGVNRFYEYLHDCLEYINLAVEEFVF